MADKPSYIGLLNAIANGERMGHKIFRNWAAVTTCDDIRGTLQTVAIREAEHAWAFEKRLCELGFGLRKKAFPDLKKTLKIAKSTATDVEKFEHLGYGKKSKGGADDGLTKLLDDLACVRFGSSGRQLVLNRQPHVVSLALKVQLPGQRVTHEMALAAQRLVARRG